MKTLRVLRRGHSNNRREIPNKVRLVEIPQIHRQPVVGLTVRHVFCSLMQAVALDDSLGADADVSTKPPLQGAGAATDILRQIFYSQD